MAVNKVILVGNVGKDPEVRYLDENTAVAKFPLATSETYKNREGEKVEQTEWHNIVIWRGLAKVVESYVKKGSQLYIEGRIRTRSYDDREGNKRYITEIVGDVMQMLGRRSDDQQGGSYGQQSASQSGGQGSAQVSSAPAAPQQPQATPQAAPQQNAQQGNAQQGNAAADNAAFGGGEPDDLPF